ncbi:winged helix DNA-binding domain-containing protein [Nonomuraea sp. NBC_01738]|uniref:winged helix DNA-binding domain-containing protein n=1 Tax=Nonomuraea sp. NBC_01738 TaxID=2976003 RepID=UPI002E160BA9|nr:winged helix DNA-binding domain-containing protein [Nonomuraea sp. NBC_01738]
MELTPSTLNRTTLHRQLLLERAPLTALEAVGRLVAVQAQEANSPYLSLWTRLRGFGHDELTSLLYGRQVVRGSLLRGTQHLAASGDYVWLRPMMQERLGRARQAGFGRVTRGIDLDELAEAARGHLSGRTLTRSQLSALLAERWPLVEKPALGWSAQALLPIVHAPPSGTWNKGGATPFTLAEEWLGRKLEPAPPVERLVVRYLAAYGPAGVMDVQMWSGLTRLREVIEGMGLREYRSAGRVLYDLPDAPLVAGEVAAPVRFLPYFDNLVVAFADRGRLMTAEQRRAVCVGAIIHPVFLVDGVVGGMWDVEDGALVLRPLAPLPDEARGPVEEEGARLLAFMGSEGGAITWRGRQRVA